MRAVAGQPATVRLQLATDGGTAEAPDATPTVTVTAGDGTPLYTAQAGAQVTSGGSPVVGAYTWKLPAQAKLDQLTAVWSCTVGGVPFTVPVDINVVAQRLVSPFRMRNTDTNLASLADEDLLWLVDQVEDAIEDVLGYPPVLEGARIEWDTLRGTLTDALYISGTVNGLPYGWGAGTMLIPGVKLPVVGPPGAVYSGSINGVALDPTTDIPKLQVMKGALAWADYRPWISGRYQLWLTHGEPTPPQDLRAAAAKLISYFGKTTNWPDRAAQVQTEGATILFSMPTSDRPFGIPEVDAVVNRHRLESVI